MLTFIQNGFQASPVHFQWWRFSYGSHCDIWFLCDAYYLTRS